MKPKTSHHVTLFVINQIKIKVMNQYLDINYVDRTNQIESAFAPTLQDIKEDPEFYAKLVNDLMYHWVYATRETPIMNEAKKNLLIANGDKK